MTEAQKVACKKTNGDAAMTPSRPVFKCLPRQIGEGYKDGMMFWCPYCKTWHRHGRGNGHRVAHCNRNSPLHQNGYVLKMATKAELKEIHENITCYLTRHQP